MSLTPAFFAHARQQGDLLASAVLARDNLQLGPAFISQAAARRLKAGLRAVEAYLRRFLLLLALSLEAGLPRTVRTYIVRARAVRSGRPSPGFRVLTGERDVPEELREWGACFPALSPGSEPVQAAPLLARLAALRALLNAPNARARRLAFHLARRRPGLLLAPDHTDAHLPRRFGTEVSMLYAGLSPAILAASRARPPPLGACPRVGPRIRAVID